METKIDKKHRIIEQAKIEFSNYLFEEASINRIIKEINMPRGTFYLYFENKEDLYFTMLEDLDKTTFKYFESISKELNGDIREILLKIFELAQTNKTNLMRNIFINFNTTHFDRVLPKHEERIRLCNFFDYSKFHLETEEDKFIFGHLLLSILIQNICLSVKHKENSKEFFIKQIDMVLTGKER